MAKVTMPQLGESVAEGTIGRWLKQPGDTVAKYEPLLEVITDKVNAEVPSPYAGVLREILAEEGATVPNDAEIAVIETEGETAAEGASPAAEAAPAADEAAPAADGWRPQPGPRPQPTRRRPQPKPAWRPSRLRRPLRPPQPKPRRHPRPWRPRRPRRRPTMPTRG